MRYANTDNDLATLDSKTSSSTHRRGDFCAYLPSALADRPNVRLNTAYIEWYFSQVDLFQFGWSGFKGVNNSIDVSGQFWWALT